MCKTVLESLLVCFGNNLDKKAPEEQIWRVGGNVTVAFIQDIFEQKEEERERSQKEFEFGVIRIFGQ